MNFYVICYDITEDKRRNRVARTLEAQAERVQGSVFEAHLPADAMQALVEELEKVYDSDLDSIRIYRLCAECKPKVRTLGIGRVTPEPGVMII
jgi:CRISPR-associated protein Cas2